MKSIIISGTRGIPAKHGGFETYAERFAHHLTEQGWKVTVYCQTDKTESNPMTEIGLIQLRHFSAPKGAFGTIIFDLKCVLNSCRRDALVLTLGYNTSVFHILYRLFNTLTVMNMDGFEWKRGKWPLPVRFWLLLNQFLGIFLSKHLVADHPEMERYFRRFTYRGKISVAAYGADDLMSELPLSGQSNILSALGVDADRFALVIARPEPENQILEIVQAFVQSGAAGKLVVLGSFDTAGNVYHAKVIRAASENVIFPGAIYDQSIVKELRRRCKFYVHGHTVGGTNPSLVEAMGAGKMVLAHDNKFNRWVLGEGGEYFDSVFSLAQAIRRLFSSNTEAKASKIYARYKAEFQWESILKKHEAIVSKIWSDNRG